MAKIAGRNKAVFASGGKRLDTPMPTAKAVSAVTKRSRIVELVARPSDLPVEERAEQLDGISVNVVKRAKHWKNGDVPFTFENFVKTIDENAPLQPKQLEVFMDTGMNNADAWISPDRHLNEIVLLWGKGSGKDWLAAKVNAYIAYLMDRMAVDPAVYYRDNCGLVLASDTVLAALNVAPAGDLAVETYFRYLLNNLTHPMFDSARPIIMSEEVLFCTPEERLKAKDQKRKPIPYFVIASKNSAASGLDGYNLISWIMDEADAFVNSDKKNNAELIHNILISSCATRMRNLWTGFVISYPRVKEGFMLTTYERAKRNMVKFGRKASFYSNLASVFEVRPSVSRDDPTIREQYENDPDAAAALYECIPMETIDAFIEMPEKVDGSVDNLTDGVAYVQVEDYQTVRSTGFVDYYVRAKVSNIKPVAGHTYFLAGDAGGYGKQIGKKGDAYALSVWHSDSQSDGFAWICPRCVQAVPTILQGARYERQPQGAREAVKPGQFIVCGACMTTSALYNGSFGAGSVSVAGWWKKLHDESGVLRDQLGRAYSVGHLYEDLLVRVSPVRKGYDSPVNRSVFFPAIQSVCRELIEKLPVQAARFDPHQTAEITQALREEPGGDIDTIGFSNPDQYLRAKLGKMMLYAGLLHFLPNPIRDREWKRVQRINGNKIDHPDGPNESKDLFDVECVCIFMAVTSKVGSLELLMGNEAGAYVPPNNA